MRAGSVPRGHQRGGCRRGDAAEDPAGPPKTTGVQQTIPEPATVVLTGFALLVFTGLRHRKKLRTLR